MYICIYETVEMSFLFYSFFKLRLYVPDVPEVARFSKDRRRTVGLVCTCSMHMFVCVCVRVCVERYKIDSVQNRPYVGRFSFCNTVQSRVRRYGISQVRAYKTKLHRIIDKFIAAQIRSWWIRDPVCMCLCMYAAKRGPAFVLSLI